MKKLSILSLAAIFIAVGLLFPESELKAQYIKEWYSAGNSHTFGLKKSIYKKGSNSAFLELTGKKENAGFVSFMQTCLADEFLGKRIKLTAYVKTKNASENTGVWMNVFSEGRDKHLSFDNILCFGNILISGTKNWSKCEILLDVPEESGTISFGVSLVGRPSKIWFDFVSFEIVNKMDTEITVSNEKYPIGPIVEPVIVLTERPTNLEFK